MSGAQVCSWPHIKLLSTAWWRTALPSGLVLPPSHISQLHAVETKAFGMIGISRDEAESLGLSLSHRRQVGGLSVFCRLLSGLAPQISAECSRSASNPLLVKLPKSRITAHLHFHSSFFLHMEQTPTLSSIPLFRPDPQNSCSSPSLIFPHPKPWSFIPPLIHPKPTTF